MNVVKFKQKLLERKLSQKDFAESLGITYQGLWKKLDSNNWTLEDIKKTKRILQLSDDDIRAIFEL